MVKKTDVLKKDEKEKLREEVLKEINSTVKEELVLDVVKDIKASINDNYKNEIKDTIKSSVIKEVRDEIKKDQAKALRRKSFKIFRLYIYIILLTACSIYCIYKLYKTDNLDIVNRYRDKTTTSTTIKVENNDNNQDNEKDEFITLKNKYGYLIDNINITNYELLKGSYSVEKIDITDLLAIAYKSLDKNDIIKEGIIYKFKEESLKSQFNKLFGEINFKNSNFQVDGLSYAYSESDKMYLAIGNENIKGEIINEMYNIKEIDDGIIIDTYVALNIDNKIYNIFNIKEEISDNLENLSEVLDKLSKVEYTFKYKNGSYYLDKIEKNN